MKKVDNITFYSRFYLGVILFTLAGIVPQFMEIDNAYTPYLPYFTIGLSILAIGIVRPAYFSLTIINGDRLQIQTSIGGDDPMDIYRSEFAGFKLTPHLKGWRNDLVIFRRTDRGLMHSREVRVSLLTKVQQRDLILMLNEFNPDKPEIWAN